VVICLEQGADLHMAQLMPLPLTVSCFSKIQIDFTFLVLAHLGSRGKRAIKRGGVSCAYTVAKIATVKISFGYLMECTDTKRNVRMNKLYQILKISLLSTKKITF